MDTILYGRGGNLTASTDRFAALVNSSRAQQTTVTGDKSIGSISGTISKLYVRCQTAAGGGFTRTFEVYKNGANTGVKVDLGPSATTGSDLTNSVAFAASDFLSLRTSATGTTAGTGEISWSVSVAAAANVSLVCGGSMGSVSATVDNYVPLSGNVTPNTGAAPVTQTCPAAGTLKNLYVALSAAPGTATTYTATLYKNGSATALTVTISGTATTGNDVANSVSVAAGDTLVWRIIPSTPVNPTARIVMIGVEFDPTTDGEFVIMHSNGANTSTTVARFDRPAGGFDAAPGATENDFQMVSNACTWSKLYVSLSVAPGSGKSYQIQNSLNGSAGNPSVTISAAATTGSDLSNTRTIAGGDLIAMKITPSGTPTAAAISWSRVGVVGAAAQTLLPSAIATAEAFGTAALTTGGVTIAPTAIATAEAFGTAVFTTGAVDVSPSAIATAEAFGTAVLSTGNVDVAPAAIASAEALGTAVFTTGEVLVAPTGIATAEAFGTAVFTTGAVDVSPSAIASAEAFGDPVLSNGGAIIAPDPIASAEAFGTAVFTTGGVTIEPAAIASAEAFGAAALTTGAVDVSPTGIATAEAVGAPIVSAAGAVIAPDPIASAEALGTAVFTTGGVTIEPAAIASAEAFGAHTLAEIQLVEPAAIASAEAFGAATFAAGAPLDVTGRTYLLLAGDGRTFLRVTGDGRRRLTLISD